MLRIKEFSFTRTIAEEGGIELLNEFRWQHGTSFHVLRIAHDGGIDPGLQQFLLVKKRDRLNAVLQVVPELLHARGSWEATRHGQDRDIGGPLTCVGSVAALLQARLRRFGRLWWQWCEGGEQIVGHGLDGRSLEERHHGKLDL